MCGRIPPVVERMFEAPPVLNANHIQCIWSLYNIQRLHVQQHVGEVNLEVPEGNLISVGLLHGSGKLLKELLEAVLDDLAKVGLVILHAADPSQQTRHSISALKTITVERRECRATKVSTKVESAGPELSEAS